MSKNEILAYKELPENYNAAIKLDAKSFVGLVTGVGAGLLLLAVCVLPCLNEIKSFFTDSMIAAVLLLICECVLSLFTSKPHEELHRWALRIHGLDGSITMQDITPNVKCESYMTQKVYIFYTLTPMCVLGGFFALLSVLSPIAELRVFFAVQTGLALAGGGSDLVNVLIASKLGKDTLVKDDGTVFTFYRPEYKEVR